MTLTMTMRKLGQEATQEIIGDECDHSRMNPMFVFAF